MIYAIVGAVLIGVSLGLLGSGGSILTVPILLALGHADKQAIAEALAIVGAISLFGAIRQAFYHQLDFRAAALFALPGMAGSFLGAWLAHWIPGPVQIVALGVIMFAAAAMMAFSSTKERPNTESPHYLLMLLAGFAVGTITGLVGVGGGFLIVPTLVLFAHVPITRSIGTSLAVIAFNSAVGFYKYDAVLRSHSQSVDWETILIFITAGILGTLVGSAIGEHVNKRTLKSIFAAFLLVMGIALIAWKLSSI